MIIDNIYNTTFDPTTFEEAHSPSYLDFTVPYGDRIVSDTNRTDSEYKLEITLVDDEIRYFKEMLEHSRIHHLSFGEVDGYYYITKMEVNWTKMKNGYLLTSYNLNCLHVSDSPYFKLSFFKSFQTTDWAMTEPCHITIPLDQTSKRSYIPDWYYAEHQNMLPPNIARGGAYFNTVDGFVAQNTSVVTYSTDYSINGEGCSIKTVTNGSSSGEGVKAYTSFIPVLGGQAYSFAVNIYGISGKVVSRINFYDSANNVVGTSTSAYTDLDGTEQTIEQENIVAPLGSVFVTLYIFTVSTAQAITFYTGKWIFNQGSSVVDGYMDTYGNVGTLGIYKDPVNQVQFKGDKSLFYYGGNQYIKSGEDDLGVDNGCAYIQGSLNSPTKIGEIVDDLGNSFVSISDGFNYVTNDDIKLKRGMFKSQLSLNNNEIIIPYGKNYVELKESPNDLTLTNKQIIVVTKNNGTYGHLIAYSATTPLEEYTDIAYSGTNVTERTHLNSPGFIHYTPGQNRAYITGCNGVETHDLHKFNAYTGRNYLAWTTNTPLQIPAPLFTKTGTWVDGSGYTETASTSAYLTLQKILKGGDYDIYALIGNTNGTTSPITFHFDIDSVNQGNVTQSSTYRVIYLGNHNLTPTSHAFKFAPTACADTCRFRLYYMLLVPTSGPDSPHETIMSALSDSTQAYEN
jgi:hypothetical protein